MLHRLNANGWNGSDSITIFANACGYIPHMFTLNFAHRGIQIHRTILVTIASLMYRLHLLSQHGLFNAVDTAAVETTASFTLRLSVLITGSKAALAV